MPGRNQNNSLINAFKQELPSCSNGTTADQWVENAMTLLRSKPDVISKKVGESDEEFALHIIRVTYDVDHAVASDGDEQRANPTHDEMYASSAAGSSSGNVQQRRCAALLSVAQQQIEQADYDQLVSDHPTPITHDDYMQQFPRPACMEPRHEQVTLTD